MSEKSQSLEEVFLELKERQDTEIYFKKNFKIKDKRSSVMIPFEINESQRKLKDIIDKWDNTGKKQTLYIIILKSRQQGFSTYAEADFFKRILHEKNKIAMVISYDDDSATTINEMANKFYQHLPPDKKPFKRESRGKGVILENPKYDPQRATSDKNNPGLQSKFLVETSSNVNAGSGYTINYLHISELGKWNGDIEKTLTSLLPSIPTGSIIIIESTARGYNYFKDLWDDSNEYIHENGKLIKKNDYVPLFIPWFEDVGATMPYDGFELTDFDSGLWGNEVQIKSTFNLTNDQMAWRRFTIKNVSRNSLNAFKQEFPSTPKEAFIASGESVFDNQILDLRLQKIMEFYKTNPPKRGMYQYVVNKEGMIDHRSITFEPNRNGLITIYKPPRKGYPYVIGGDTAGEGSNKFGMLCIDNTTGEQMAVLHGHLAADKYAEQAYCMGIKYNEALIALESNFDYAPILRLQQLMYWHMYKREVIDSAETTVQEKYGFQTTQKTRPVIINNLVTMARDEANLFNDIAMINEMMEFAYDKSRKPTANPGKNDDLVMTAAITYFCSEQMWTSIENTEEEHEDDDDDDDEIEASNWITG